MGFFSASEVDSSPGNSTIPQCGACQLHKECQSPKMAVTGEGQKGILVVAEAPGKTEDERGVQLVGKAGQELREALSALGCDLDRDCWKTNAVICRPEDNKLNERCIEYCRPNIVKAIDDLNPRVIILLGGAAVRSVIGLEQSKVGELGRWVGWTIPLQSRNVWLCPTYHPSYLLRSNSPVLSMWFRKHLEKALGLLGRPWNDVPDYLQQITVEISPEKAAAMIRSATARSDGPIAFDYETDRLKPDHPDAEIVSCAICWEGKKTLAYPWTPETAAATSEVLRSPVPKYGANIKFEQRWTKAKLGHEVKGWRWDCMQAAHVLDCRRGITSVKFQAHVRLGQADWSQKVAPYLKATGGNRKNRIRQVPMRDLLLYNGMDALIEFITAIHQMNEMEEFNGTAC